MPWRSLLYSKDRRALGIKYIWYLLPGDCSEVELPDISIPNSEVKHFSAENTWTARFWEDRSLPGFTRDPPIGGFFVGHRYNLVYKYIGLGLLLESYFLPLFIKLDMLCLYRDILRHLRDMFVVVIRYHICTQKDCSASKVVYKPFSYKIM